MRNRRSLILTFVGMTALAAPLAAQGRGRDQPTRVPPGHLPPAGMCRIWIDGVPPGQQPAPTDCQTAVRNQPRNSRILWGDDTARPGRGDARNRRDDDDREVRRERQSGGDIDRRRRDRDVRTEPACIDNDRNGWCDYHPDVRSGVRTRDGTRAPGGTEGGTTTPVDRGQYPSALPAMTGAVLIRVGVRTVDVQNWLGRGDLRSETVDDNGDGVPELATWYDGQGTVLQIWRDENRDGRADSVEVYRSGQRIAVLR